MGDLTAVCTVHFFVDNEELKDNIVMTNVSSLVEVSERLYAYYKDDLYSVTISLIDSTFLEITDEEKEKILNGKD